MRIVKSALVDFALTIGAFGLFCRIVWLYSGVTLGFSIGIQYDARAMVDAFPVISCSIASVIFVAGFGWQYRRLGSAILGAGRSR